MLVPLSRIGRQLLVGKAAAHVVDHFVFLWQLRMRHVRSQCEVAVDIDGVASKTGPGKATAAHRRAS
jgi:hypothetical protein